MSTTGIRNSLPHSREELADTVEALTHKVSLPSGVKDKLHAAKDTVQAKLGQAKRHLNSGKGVARAEADEVTRQAKNLTNQAREQVPAPVAGRLNHLTQAVRQRPVSAAALVFTMFVLLLLPRQFRKTER